MNLTPTEERTVLRAMRSTLARWIKSLPKTFNIADRHLQDFFPQGEGMEEFCRENKLKILHRSEASSPIWTFRKE
jgi:hypothetical protein